MADRKAMSGVMILKTFFGLLPGQTNQTFAAELKALSPSEKTELIVAAAQELDVDVKVAPTKT